MAQKRRTAAFVIVVIVLAVLLVFCLAGLAIGKFNLSLSLSGMRVTMDIRLCVCVKCEYGHASASLLH